MQPHSTAILLGPTCKGFALFPASAGTLHHVLLIATDKQMMQSARLEQFGMAHAWCLHAVDLQNSI